LHKDLLNAIYEIIFNIFYIFLIVGNAVGNYGAIHDLAAHQPKQNS